VSDGERQLFDVKCRLELAIPLLRKVQAQHATRKALHFVERAARIEREGLDSTIELNLKNATKNV